MGGGRRGGQCLVDDRRDGWHVGRPLVWCPLVVLPHHLGKNAEREEEDADWISTDLGSKQNCFRGDRVNETAAK